MRVASKERRTTSFCCVTHKPTHVVSEFCKLPEHVVADFSNDQKLAYFYAIGVQTGKLPDDVARKVNSAQMIIQ